MCLLGIVFVALLATVDINYARVQLCKSLESIAWKKDGCVKIDPDAITVICPKCGVFSIQCCHALSQNFLEGARESCYTVNLKSKTYRRNYNKEHNAIRNISSTEPSNEMFVDEVSFQQQNDVTKIDSVQETGTADIDEYNAILRQTHLPDAIVRR